MVDDIEDGTANEQPADDIRSALNAAVAEVETPAPGPDAAAAKPDASATADDATAAAADGRVRGPDGKFLKKDDAAAADAGKAAAKSAAPDPAAAPKIDDATAAVAAPESWKPADKEAFKTLPFEMQKLISDNSRAQLADYTRKTQAIAALKNEYGPVDEMFAPHKDVMRQKGFTPRSLIESWANVEMKLAGGPDSAIEVIRGLVSGYNIPVEKLASSLGITKAQAAAVAAGHDGQKPVGVENGQVVPLPPEVQARLDALQQKVTGFEQKFGTIEQREQAQRDEINRQQENEAERVVNEFRRAKDEKGNLLHPHMEEVEGMMTALANAALASKQPVPSLKELYETAVYATPSTREKVLTAERQQEEAKRTEEARQKAAAARKAGSSVNGAPGPGQAPNGKSMADLSLREQLEAAADEAA